MAVEVQRYIWLESSHREKIRCGGADLVINSHDCNGWIAGYDLTAV